MIKFVQNAVQKWSMLIIGKEISKEASTSIVV
jgi:hypothetical protein